MQYRKWYYQLQNFFLHRGLGQKTPQTHIATEFTAQIRKLLKKHENYVTFPRGT